MKNVIINDRGTARAEARGTFMGITMDAPTGLPRATIGCNVSRAIYPQYGETYIDI